MDETGDGHATPFKSAYAEFRHSGWKRLRARTRDCLSQSGCPVSRLKRFDECGTHCSLWHSKKADAFQIRGQFCRNRWCVPCSTARSVRIKQNLAAWLQGRPCRFLTFTLKQHDPETLEQMLTRLRRSLTRLYRRPAWQSHVHGWATFIEVKRSSRQKAWHIHAHILADGSFWPQKELAAEWHTVTGDSMIVDIRAVTDAKGGAYYAAKYASKPCDTGSLETDAELQEAITTLGSRKLWSIGGTWKKLCKLLEALTDAADWEPVAFLDDLLDSVSQHVPESVALWNAVIHATEPRPPPTSNES